MQRARRPSSNGSRRRPVATFALWALVALLGLSLLPSAPASAARADGAGFVDFAYGSATNDVTAHSSQSKVWWNAGSWWAVMMEPAEGGLVPHETRWAIFRLDMPSQTWVSTRVQVDERNQSHPDVLAFGNRLYVVSSYSRTETGAVKVFAYDYAAASDTYVLDPLFVDSDPIEGSPGRFDDGIETPAKGVQYATIARSNDSLFIAYTSNNGVWWMRSDLTGVTWEGPAQISTGARSPISGPPGPATSSSDDIAQAVGFGDGQVGIMWSRTSTTAAPYGGFFFATFNGSGFGDPEVAWEGADVGDNHISVKTAGARVLVAVKTSFKGTDDPLVSVLERNGSTPWAQHTVITRNAAGVSRDATRPVLVLDQGSAHVFMTDRVDGGAIYRNAAPLSTLSFPNGLGEAFIASSAHQFVNDATTTKQQVDTAAWGLVALGSDDRPGVDTYLHGCIGGPCATGGVAPPPTAATPTSTALTTSPNPSTAGGAVTLDATVTGGPGIGGTITFFDGTAQLKTVALSGGSASTTTATLGEGTHPLRAVYSSSGTYAASSSPVVTQTVLAAPPGSASGGGGPITRAPVGTRFQVLATPKRVVTGRKVGPRKIKTVGLPAPAGAKAVAVNVSVQAGTKRTVVSVCAGGTTKAACKRSKVVRVDERDRKAGLATVTLPAGAEVRVYNSRGKARVSLDVQGWYVRDASRALFTGLARPQRVLKWTTVGSHHVLKIPKSMRPSGTVAVELALTAKRAGRSSALAACRKAASQKACLAHPTLYPDRGTTVTNRVIVKLDKKGRVQLVNGSGSVLVKAFLRGVYTRS